MKRIPKQPRRYKFFFLNPYIDVRFSSCPKCVGKTKLRKVALVVKIEQHDPVILNRSCRYCAACDLLIAHQNEIEQELKISKVSHNSELALHSYSITGTLDRSDWQRLCQNRLLPPQLQQNQYHFKQVLKFQPTQWIKLNVEWKLID